MLAFRVHGHSDFGVDAEFGLTVYKGSSNLQVSSSARMGVFTDYVVDMPVVQQVGLGYV